MGTGLAFFPTSRRRGSRAEFVPIAGTLICFLTFALPLSAHEHWLSGELTEVGGLRVLKLVGSAPEQGFTEGYLLADAIVELVEGFALSRKVVPVPKLWDLLIRPAVDLRVTIPETTRERYAGVLSGVRARRGTLLVDSLERPLAIGDLVAAATIPDLQGLLCSSYAAWGPAVEPKQSLIVGRNLDYFATSALTRNTLLIVSCPQPPRLGWVSIGWPGVGGCLTGISEAGLFVAIHDVRVWGRESNRFTPRLLALQELIERIDPRSTPDVAARARELLQSYRFGMGANVLVAWEKSPQGPGACVLELDGRSSKEQGVSLRRPGEASYIACTNHFRERREKSRCRRYQVLWNGLNQTSEDALTRESGWDLVCRPSKRNTIYRLTCSLPDGAVRLERRRKPGGKGFLGSEINIYELLRETAGMTPTPVETTAESK